MKILRLKEVLKEKGLTGKELAEKVNVTEATISNLAKGDSIPRKELLIQIAEVLDVDIKELFNSTKGPGEQETLYIFKDDSYIPIGTIKI
ncbi:helix-turn-helix transcriptional regulator [Empedobacter sp.]|uniref:helix-turn-helix domain-containing protein n=1 Tax=Empedobacter sp. TaxID=1927715 RepID=UPI002896AF58|nr:helix-turn-helix transcriptional regulator [Empedobacter sp.]